jgi:glycopeptide antibiotics resistance protein
MPNSGAVLATCPSMIPARELPLWVWWVPVVMAISLPWSGLVSSPQWDRVHMIPFTDPADRPRDFVANIALFVPFGCLYGRRRSVWGAVAVAAALSVTAEATQLFSTTRFPSATDITAALAGAALGVAASSLWTRTSPAPQTSEAPRR